MMLFGMLPGIFQFATEQLFVDPQILAVSLGRTREREDQSRSQSELRRLAEGLAALCHIWSCADMSDFAAVCVCVCASSAVEKELESHGRHPSKEADLGRLVACFRCRKHAKQPCSAFGQRSSSPCEDQVRADLDAWLQVAHQISKHTPNMSIVCLDARSIEICCETVPDNCTGYALEHSLIQFDEKPAILEIPAAASTRCNLTARGRTLDVFQVVINYGLLQNL